LEAKNSVCVETVIASGFGKTNTRLTAHHPVNLCISVGLQATLGKAT